MSSKPSAISCCSRSRATGRGHLRSNGSPGPWGLGVGASRSTRTLVTMARRPPRSRKRLMPSRSAPQLERAPEPTQPSNSWAARTIHFEPAHEPISTGGPPRTAGHTGASEAPFTLSPFQSRRMMPSDSSSRRKRAAKSRPSALKSASVEPEPTPNSSRPPDTRCVVSTRWASSTGLRSGTWSTPVPNSRPRVTLAATLSAMSGSACSQPRPMESKAHALVKPAASMPRAASAMVVAVMEPVVRSPEGSAIPKRVMGWSMLSTKRRVHMRFGIFTSMGMQTWAGVLDLWKHIESTGWDIACVTDHFMPNTPEKEGAMLEAWSTLSALAALVPRMRVGTIVLGNTYRHPAVVAKMAAQVDIISGGRLLLGLGSGWQQNEHQAYGIPFYTMRERLERLDEACQVMRSLWTEKRTTFKGHYYQLSDAPLDPKPVQTPHPELMIGGGGERVTLRIVAKHADHWNVWGGPKVLARKGAILDEHCAAVGRDPKALRRSANMSLLITDKKEDVERLADTIAKRMGRHAADARDTCLAGTPDQIREQLRQLKAARVDTLFIPSMFRPLDELRRDLDRFITEIAPEFR